MLPGQGSMRVSVGIERHHFFDSFPARRHLLLLPSAINSTFRSFTILHFFNMDYARCTVGKECSIAYSFNNEALAELVLRYSGHLSSLLASSAQLIQNTVWETFHVRATSSLASVMIWTLGSWVLVVPSDFADLGQKRWEKIYVDGMVAACWNRVQNYCHVFVS